jgi:coenzyme F420-reducing hydrogenase alpha subunit
VGSVIPLAKSAPEVVLRAAHEEAAGDLCAAICGRHTHPIAMTVGGFTHFPSTADLEQLRERLEAARADVDATVELFQKLHLPAFERETEYVALRKDDEYCFIDGEIASTDGGSWPVERYREITNETVIRHSSAKRAHHKRAEYMVGALARFNVNHERLHLKAKSAATALGLKPKCTNPYLITVAQVVEIVHCMEDAIHLADLLLKRGVPWEEPAAPARLSGGTGGATFRAERCSTTTSLPMGW